MVKFMLILITSDLRALLLDCFSKIEISTKLFSIKIMLL